MLDDVICMTRAGTIANRTLVVTNNYVTATLDKPRKYYILDMSEAPSIGPAFTPDGKLVGMIVLRKNPAIDLKKLNSAPVNFILVTVLPAATIADEARQAQDAQPTPAPAQ